ncbi:metallophosphoesterase [Gimibacter soli]|uniref:Metallophosphoesterase n=1 Tax=Gimibacter soli TaxID=3024400 RepID=A0AAE9XLZ8_9PROT|nr:metallophosphoesterase [Gimibacter soli]WCL53382.1 metallophosphoesterase [Gimibacter soli]
MKTFWGRLSRKKTVPPRDWALPDGVIAYAIGDIHGRLDLLLPLIAKIEADLDYAEGVKEAYLIPLGDYIDRGFQSREVIDFFAAYSHPKLKLVPLVGNHELMLFDFLRDPATGPRWFAVGGRAACQSYGVPVPVEVPDAVLADTAKALKAAIPKSHADFLLSLQLEFRLGDYYFVHAGLRPGVPLEDQKVSDKLMIRDAFTQGDHGFDLCVVHGHTGVNEVTMEAGRIAVDTGAFATGKLSAVGLMGTERWIIA